MLVSSSLVSLFDGVLKRYQVIQSPKGALTLTGEPPTLPSTWTALGPKAAQGIVYTPGPLPPIAPASKSDFRLQGDGTMTPIVRYLWSAE